MGKVTYIPAARPFLRTLIQGLMARADGDPMTLADMTLILPTRRAVRAAKDLFLDITDGQPLLLPRLCAVGDVDDQDLTLLVAGCGGNIDRIPPAIPDVDRQFVLTQMVRARDPGLVYTQAAALARALAGFLDQLYDEGLSLENLDGLVAAEYAAHWQLTVDFLSILRTVWPTYLSARGQIDNADRRGRLLSVLTVLWASYPPSSSIIMAGISGSLPKVAELMKAVVALPQGEVILSGHDPDLPDAWRTHLTPDHSHFESEKVLDNIGVARSDIVSFDGIGPYNNVMVAARAAWWRIVMRPGDVLPLALPLSMAPVLSGIRIIEADTPADEAKIVALGTRQALGHPTHQVIIVTPDRALAPLIIAACAAQGVVVNDSAGEVLPATSPAQFFMLILDVIQAVNHPVDLLALIKHPLFNTDHFSPDQVDILNQEYLRGIRPPSTWPSLLAVLKLRGAPDNIIFGLRQLGDILEPLARITDADHAAFLTTHIQVAETLAGLHEHETIMWLGEDGVALADRLRDVLTAAPVFINTLGDYRALLTDVLSQVMVNRRGVGHPRVALLGVFEARLLGADHVILAGFNEGQWPRAAGADPWLSRGMRRDLGLPPIDQKIGRQALDFLSFVQADDVLITRSRRADGLVTLPSRWLQRFDTMYAYVHPDGTMHRDVTLPALAAQNSNKDRPRAIRPRPCPPSFMRPKNYSATQIGHLMTNPYAFYAQKILSLRPLNPLAERLRPLDRGNILHAVLAEFTTQYPQNLPLAAENILLSILDKILNNWGVSDADQVICRPRLAHILKVYLGQDKAWRDDRCTVVETQEKKYSSTINVAGKEIEISARLDRMDINRIGEAIIFDYKTGTGQIKRAPVDQGTAPQLPIQAWLVARVAEQPVSGVGYWPLLARPEKFVLWEDTAIHDLVSAVDQGLPELLRVFLQATTPYWPVPDPDRDPGYNDYNHLMRRDEWDGQDEERHE